MRSSSTDGRARALVVAFAVIAPHANGASVEAIFGAARQYTVYIETRIETPFIEDDPGSYLGAGFIVDRQRGWVMTNAHVVGHSPAELEVSFADGAKATATPLYIDSFLDLAVIQLPEGVTRAHTEARLDCAQRPDVGVPVGAYGHPNGYKFSGTRGIVSGFSTKTGSSGLQTDAPINSGNSGGPLIRLDTGRVVGINTESLVGDDVQNMNFAVETRYACRVLALLQQGADPRPAALDALFYTEDGEPTLVVAHAGQHATEAGLRSGDRIVAVDGGVIEPADLAELTHRLRGVQGDMTLRVMRANRSDVTLHYRVTLDDAVLNRRGFVLGGALFAATHYEDVDLLIDQPKLMVHFVAPGSAAESAGLAAFDQLISVNGQPIHDVDELARLARAAPSGVAELDVIRWISSMSRFSRHVRASLPLDHTQWVAMRDTSDSAIGDTAHGSNTAIEESSLTARSVSVGEAQ